MKGEAVEINGVSIKNVLVEPGQAQDVKDIDVPAGETIAYTLRLPKTGALHIDAPAIVRGLNLKIAGYSDYYDTQGVFGSSWSLPWVQTALVSYTGIANNVEISIVTFETSLNALGDAQTTETVIYTGSAQMRQQNATEGAESAGITKQTTAIHSFYFVLPWSDEFSNLSSVNTVIICNDIRYNVRGIVNVDGKSETASFMAVLNE